MTGNAENIKKALESPEKMENYYFKISKSQVIADITAYAQSQQKEPDRVLLAAQFLPGLLGGYWEPKIQRQAESCGSNIDVAVVIAAFSVADEFIKQSKQ